MNVKICSATLSTANEALNFLTKDSDLISFRNFILWKSKSFLNPINL